MSLNSCAWKAPSNIALVKYWGKHGRQLPMNPSISFTLNSCATSMEMMWTAGSGKVYLSFAGQKAQKFEDKIHAFLHSIIDLFPFIPHYDFYIKSENSFPHSAGIASSASSMAALSLCLCTMAQTIEDFPAVGSDSFYQLANFVARLGSGSACRSIYGGAVLWGECPVEGSSNTHALPFKKLHSNFTNYQDTILVVDNNEKSVSSRVGHSLMNGHVFSQSRYHQAHHNILKTLDALSLGDLNMMGELAEEEALTLHAMMMTSHPSYILMKANTLIAIDEIRKFRKESALPLYFTLDAGPNLHLLYPESIKIEVNKLIDSKLSTLCMQDAIYDSVGCGPEKLA